MMRVPAILAMCSVPAHADYVALAYDPKTDDWAIARSENNRHDAEARALGQCRTKSPGCKSVLWIEDGCGALAYGTDSWGTGSAPDLNVAEGGAMYYCRAYGPDCAVRATFCSTSSLTN